MAQNITLLGASYSDVPAVTLPKTGGGTATFYDASETETITQNGTYDVRYDASVVVNVSGGGGSSINAQAHQSTTRATSSSYTSVNSFTCNKTGTYDIYWSCMRSSTSGTWGSQLYIGGSAYGSAQTGSWSNHVQNIHLSGVQIGQGETIDVRVRSRGSNYYGYCPLVTIIEEE